MSRFQSTANVSGDKNRGVQAGQIHGDFHYHASSSDRAVSNSRETRAPRYLLPFPRNWRFTGREEELKQLRRMLFIDGYCQKVAIAGLGGIGKTQLALELAYEMKASNPQRSIFWVPAMSVDVWQEAFTSIVQLLDIPATASEGSTTVGAKVKDYLSRDEAGQWLMVIDSVDSADIAYGTDGPPGPSLMNQLPQSNFGSILFTTRNLDLATQLASSEVISMDIMSETIAYELLSDSIIDKKLLDEREATFKLLRELTYLPLAITQATAYINSSRTSISDYLELLRGSEAERAEALRHDFKDRHRYEQLPNAIDQLWVRSFDQLERESPLATKFLSIMATIEPNNIPESLLAPSSERGKSDAFGALQAYSFITKRGRTAVYDVHRLVHLAAGLWLQTKGALSYSKGAAARRLISEISTRPHVQKRSSELLPHARHLVDAVGEFDGRERAELCIKLGRALLRGDEKKEATQRIEEIERWTRNSLPVDDRIRLDSQILLVELHRANSNDAQAAQLLAHVVTVQGGMLPEDYVGRLYAERELAGAYLRDGRVQEAIKLLEHVVKVEDYTLPEDYDSRLGSQHRLARAYRMAGQPKKAQELFEHVVKVRRDTLPEDDSQRLVSQHELALAYRADGKLKEAVELLEHVVQVSASSLAEGHRSRLVSELELADVYMERRQWDRAVPLLEQFVKVNAMLPERDSAWRQSAAGKLEKAKKEAALSRSAPRPKAWQTNLADRTT